MTQSTDERLADDDTCIVQRDSCCKFLTLGIFWLIIDFGLNITMIVVGSLGSCNIASVPQFLVHGGAIMLGLTILFLGCNMCSIAELHGDLNGCVWLVW